MKLKPASIAVDGERNWGLRKDQSAFIKLTKNGPTVVSITRTLEEAALSQSFMM